MGKPNILRNMNWRPYKNPNHIRPINLKIEEKYVIKSWRIYYELPKCRTSKRNWKKNWSDMGKRPNTRGMESLLQMHPVRDLPGI